MAPNMFDRAEQIEATIQRAGFLIRPGEPTLVLADEWPERLRCASVLKPLLFWSARSLPPFDSDAGRWSRLARPAVCRSDNAATIEAWQACGGRRLLKELSAKSSVAFAAEPGGARSFGRVLVNAGETARAYASLVEADQPSARQLLTWMREVPDRQTFGVRHAAAEELGVRAERIAVKCGWYCARDEQRIRTHAVTITLTEEGIVGTAVLTAIPLDETRRRSYARRYRGGEGVLDLHETLAGCELRMATRQTLIDLRSA